jgi:effector-binding domain-containing protein
VEYEVVTSEVLPRPLAAVRTTVKLADLSVQIGSLLGEVWQFLANNKVRSTGHNVAIYLSSSGSGPDLTLDAWFGVEVHETIPASDRVVAVSTPAGRAASVVHWGDYARMHDAYEALESWCDANGHKPARTKWEVYGDWNDDWAKVRTDVFFLLES